MAALLLAAAAAFARRSAATRCHGLNYASSFSCHFSTNKPSSPNLTQAFIINKYQFSSQIASKAASFLARSKNPQNADLVLSFLKDYGFSNTQLERLVRKDNRVLSMCLENTIKPKLQILLDFGFSAAEIPEVVSRDISSLRRESSVILRSLSVLKRLLGSNDNVIKFVNKYPQLFYTDPERTILPNIEFLKSCGVESEQIDSLIYTFAYLFFLSPENVRRCVDKVDDMGVNKSSKMFIYAVRAVSTMSDDTLKLKLKSFQDLGFSEDDIMRVFGTAPVVISVSTKNIKEVIEVLLQTGKYNMSCIIKCPTSLTYSVEKRYKPRLQVLKVLERKSLINKWPSLSTICSMTNKSFFERFVALDRNELGESFLEKTAGSGKRYMETGFKPE